MFLVNRNSVIVHIWLIVAVCFVAHSVRAQTPDNGFTESDQNTNLPDETEETKSRETPDISLSEPENSLADTGSDPETIKEDKLRIVTWGGAYRKSLDNAFFEPFSDKSGIKIDVVEYKGRSLLPSPTNSKGLADLDVANLSSYEVQKSCELGLIAEIDPDLFTRQTNDSNTESDFLSAGIHKCGVGSFAWSLAIIFDKTQIKRKREPNSLKSFFNIKRFPGKRSLPEGPKYTLELALLADGVSSGEVYSTLGTEEGVARAFAVLDKIKDHLVWWKKADEPFTQLANKEVVFATAYSGRIFNNISRKRLPIKIIWDRQIYDTLFWSIASDTTNKNLALEFIKFATTPRQLAKLTMQYPYGPLRKSAIDHIGLHSAAKIDLVPFIPTHPTNFKTAIQLDSIWWKENGNRMSALFSSWLNGNSETEENIE